jgi:hypothetical protein
MSWFCMRTCVASGALIQDVECLVCTCRAVKIYGVSYALAP